MVYLKQLADFAKYQPKHSRCLMTRRLEEKMKQDKQLTVERALEIARNQLFIRARVLKGEEVNQQGVVFRIDAEVIFGEPLFMGHEHDYMWFTFRHEESKRDKGSHWPEGYRLHIPAGMTELRWIKGKIIPQPKEIIVSDLEFYLNSKDERDWPQAWKKDGAVIILKKTAGSEEIITPANIDVLPHLQTLFVLASTELRKLDDKNPQKFGTFFFNFYVRFLAFLEKQREQWEILCK